MKNTKMLVLIVLLLSIAVGAFMFWDLLTQFMAAAFLAYLLTPIAEYIVKKTGVRRSFVIFFVFIMFLVFVAVILTLSVPYLIDMTNAVIADLSGEQVSYEALLSQINTFFLDLSIPQDIIDQGVGLLANVEAYLYTLFTSLLTWTVGLSGGIFDIIIVLILMIYFMLDGKKLTKALLEFLPKEMSTRSESVISGTNVLVWKYFKTRVLISSGMAITTYIGLRIIGVPYALFFAAMSFVLDFIPYFGSMIAGAIEAVFALLTGGLSTALTVAIFVLIVQQIEGNIVAPKLQGDAVNIHPITVIFALLACNQLWGPLGMLISTPVAVLVKAIVMQMRNFLYDEAAPVQSPTGDT